MLDRAALDVDEPGDAQPHRGRRRTVGRGAEVRDDALGRADHAVRRRARSPRGPAPARDRRRPRARRASSSPRCRGRSPAVDGHRSHPAFRSTSVTATAPGWDQPRASMVGQAVGTTTGPAPLHHDRAGPAAASAAWTSGCRCASRTWTTSGPAGRSVDPGATTTSAGSPQGASPTAMVPGRVDPDDLRTVQRGQLARRRSPTAPPPRPAVRFVCGSSAGSTRRRADESRGGSPRSPPRPGAPRRAGRTATASTSAAWIDRTCSTELSAPMHSRSAPAAIDEHRGLRDPARRRDAPAMSSASLTITPSKPSRSRSSAEDRRAQRRRQLRVQGGHHDVRGHHGRRTGLDRRDERHELPRGQRRQVDVQHRQGRGGCPRRCRRAPGSAWRTRATPLDWSPSGPGGDVRRGHGAEDAPKLRVPITGLSASAVDVGDRAEVEVDADRGELAPDRPPDRPGQRRGRRPHPSASGAEHAGCRRARAAG